MQTFCYNNEFLNISEKGTTLVKCRGEIGRIPQVIIKFHVSRDIIIKMYIHICGALYIIYIYVYYICILYMYIHIYIYIHVVIDVILIRLNKHNIPDWIKMYQKVFLQ